MPDKEIHRINILDNNDQSLIVITDMKGVITNADPMDIPNENFTVLKNLRPYHGKLLLTKAFGNKITADQTPQVFDNLFTYIHPELTSDSLAGRVYIGVYINDSTKVVTLYGHDTAAAEWLTIDDPSVTAVSLEDFDATLLETIYHANLKNPIYVHNNILRILPGATGLPDGTNEGKGIWIGYIDRDYFDGQWSPSALFYARPTNVDAPDFPNKYSLYVHNEFLKISTVFEHIYS